MEEERLRKKTVVEYKEKQTSREIQAINIIQIDIKVKSFCIQIVWL